MATLAVALGTINRLVGRLIALQLVRVRFYRDLLIVFGWVPLMIGAMILEELSISIAPVISLLESCRLHGSLIWHCRYRRSGGIGSKRVRRRTWPSCHHRPAPRRWNNGSRTSNLGACARSFNGHSWFPFPPEGRAAGTDYWTTNTTSCVHRCPKTVAHGAARSTWCPVYWVCTRRDGSSQFPAVLFVGETITLLVLFAVTVGLVAGIAFGSDPIGTEYRTLPMILTSAVASSSMVGSLLQRRSAFHLLPLSLSRLASSDPWGSHRPS